MASLLHGEMTRDSAVDEPMCDDYIPMTQGNTQQDDMCSQMEPMNTAAGLPWGRLISLHSSIGHVDLVNSAATIGRRPQCEIVLDDIKVSGKHCRVSRGPEADTAILEDLSLNGTWVNRKKVGKGSCCYLKDGDVVALLRKPRLSKDYYGSFVMKFPNDDPQDTERCEVFDKYDVGAALGTGNFSTVKKGIHRGSREEVAIKVIDKRKYYQAPKKTQEQLNREVEILRTIKHPNVIAVKEIFDSPRFLYIVLELASGGELYDRIVAKGSYSEEEARSVFAQLLDAVAYLHKKGIVHRDLKPENILLESPAPDARIKITDFGLARLIDEREFCTTLCGTPLYVAPEIVAAARGDPAALRAGYSAQVDVWSLGVLLYILLSGCPPFEDAPGSPLFQKIESGIFQFPDCYWSDVSTSARDLISKMLSVDPRRRITIQGALQHPWMQVPSSPSQESTPLTGAQANMRKHKSIISSMPISPFKATPTRPSSDTEDEHRPKGSQRRSQRKLSRRLSRIE